MESILNSMIFNIQNIFLWAWVRLGPFDSREQKTNENSKTGERKKKKERKQYLEVGFERMKLTFKYRI